MTGNVWRYLAAFPRQGVNSFKNPWEIDKRNIERTPPSQTRRLRICIRPHLCVEQINTFPFLTKFHLLNGEIQSSRTHQADWISRELHEEKNPQGWHCCLGKQTKKEGIYDAYHHPCQSRMPPSKNNFEFFQSRRGTRCCAPVSLPAVPFSRYSPQLISLWHPTKPIRDLSASIPINYHPNQCRALWYRIICQISADGLGQVPPVS